MAPSEYSTPGGGGKLKLKGSKTSNGRIEKKKKKSSKKGNAEENEQQKQQEQQQLTTTTTSATASGAEEEPRANEHESSSAGAGKTEAERKYEEMRKKRLQERLKREGVKTHKERVEELNKYLSRLSEHHDMYVCFFSTPPLFPLLQLLVGRKLDRAKRSVLPRGTDRWLSYHFVSDSLCTSRSSGYVGS
ncbi:hypothetical protein AnigIFM50267_004502 [Aspergillus niger]|nr:hypothetical protein AnigIFM50267_004502 [Aspergillus niger]